jgi:hypothetical protein
MDPANTRFQECLPWLKKGACTVHTLKPSQPGWQLCILRLSSATARWMTLRIIPALSLCTGDVWGLAEQSGPVSLSPGHVSLGLAFLWLSAVMPGPALAFVAPWRSSGPFSLPLQSPWAILVGGYHILGTGGSWPICGYLINSFLMLNWKAFSVWTWTLQMCSLACARARARTHTHTHTHARAFRKAVHLRKGTSQSDLLMVPGLYKYFPVGDKVAAHLRMGDLTRRDQYNWREGGDLGMYFLVKLCFCCIADISHYSSLWTERKFSLSHVWCGWTSLIWKSEIQNVQNIKLFGCQHDTTPDLIW